MVQNKNKWDLVIKIIMGILLVLTIVLVFKTLYGG